MLTLSPTPILLSARSLAHSSAARVGESLYARRRDRASAGLDDTPSVEWPIHDQYSDHPRESAQRLQRFEAELHPSSRSHSRSSLARSRSRTMGSCFEHVGEDLLPRRYAHVRGVRMGPLA